MENSWRHRENQNPSLIPSPKSNYGCTNSTNNGFNQPVSVTRSEPNNQYPTTFVQADTSSFKQVVQMLTGSSESAKPTRLEQQFRCPIPPMKTTPTKQNSSSKLYERRNSFKNFKISPLAPGFVHNKPGFPTGSSPRHATPESLSPSILDFPSLALSPVTPLIPDPFNRSPHPKSNMDLVAEDKAIAQKGFYLHPSPADTPRDSEPRLLPLFPLTSPRLSGSSDSKNS